MIIKTLSEFTITGYPVFESNTEYLLPDDVAQELIERELVEKVQEKIQEIDIEPNFNEN